MFKQIIPVLALGLTLSAASYAQMAPMHKPMAKKPMAGKKMAAKTVYVCKDCKQTYTPMRAKKMGYKDPMGHTLTKMSKTPSGYTPGGMGKM